ncbi:MAG TPA: fused MFS/spermidine synthase [Bryobacteraceae bacterium]|nr:fused MFS/spermidine synthase [Bryobacteraceae bacterium]
MLIYACTIFLSAFLLFQVQPVIARMILPWFGGSAAVWTTCMLFFQTVLLLGYLYVYWTVRYLNPKRHAHLHIGLLLASMALLPINPGVRWKPQGDSNPSVEILLLLAACVGAQYFLLSTTSPLLQSWYARRGKGALPYRLFALSNLGSMLALVTYPALVEPYFSSRVQGTVWSVAYVSFVALCAATAYITTRRVTAFKESAIDISGGEQAPAPPSIGTQVLWIALAAVPSALLLAVTNHLTQDVAAIPFLWIVPLVLYLISFILCFDADGWYRRPVFMILLVPALGGMAYLLHTGTEDINMKVLLVAFSAAFFVCCMMCHGEMVRLKPHPKYLTSFYLMLSIGGALGGLFVGLIAPYVFIFQFEFPIVLVLCGFLAVVALVSDPRSQFFDDWTSWTVILMVSGVLALSVFCGRTVRRNIGNYKVVTRNFYGTLRVREEGKNGEWGAYRTLLHGAINHGEEWMHPQRRLDPLTYYCPASGVGLAIRTRDIGRSQKVGVFGLGAGSIAGFGRPGDTYKFYEINPLVMNLSRSQFFYLPESRGKTEVVLGDARLSLEREPKQNFDVLAVDCFSGDSIPVHLLTKEAVQLYFDHLKPDGILAVHVSNRYLDLEPVVERISTLLGKVTLQVEAEEDEEGNCFSSTWVLVASRPEVFQTGIFRGAGRAVAPSPKLRAWTDDYSSLLSVLK